MTASEVVFYLHFAKLGDNLKIGDIILLTLIFFGVCVLTFMGFVQMAEWANAAADALGF